MRKSYLADIVCGLPISENSAVGLYCSHVLEHIHRANIEVAVKNSFRIFQPGGIFRRVVSDLFWRAKDYVDHVGDIEATDLLQRRLHFKSTESPQGIEGRLLAVFGLSMHQWMYDEALMCNFLQKAGFINVRRCSFGDCEDEWFSRVELENCFISNGFCELAMECRKP